MPAEEYNVKYLTQQKHINRCMETIPHLKEKYKELECINTPQDFILYVISNPTSEPVSKYLTPKNCAFWPHFTLNPSLICADIFKVLGPFITNGHFEKDYGIRYSEKQYKTAYLDSMRCIHIGWEIENAYKLNNCQQFNL
jgi:hypothetical protein